MKILSLSHKNKRNNELDYLDFFTKNAGADMLQYAYLEPSELYSNFITLNKDYYLFSDEVDLIINNEDKLHNYLSNISNIVEIAPRSIYAMRKKTLALLSYVDKLRSYFILDYFENYLFESYKFSKEHMKDIEVSIITSDLLDIKKIDLKERIRGKKLIMCLGNLISNFKFSKQKEIIKGIASSMNKEDIFIITIEINEDIKSLLKAYSNQYSMAFIKGILEHYSKINLNFISYIDAFETICLWNKNLNCIEFSFKAKENISFNYNKDFELKIKKGQKLKGVRLYKSSKLEFQNLLEQCGFSIKEILTQQNRTAVFICSRNENVNTTI